MSPRFFKKFNLAPAALAAALLMPAAPLPAQDPAQEPPAPPLAANSEGQNIGQLVQQYEDIAKTIDRYIEGGRQGSGEVMKAAFHPGANIFGFVDGQPVGGPIQMLYDLVDSRPAAKEIPYKITRLEIMEDIAMARVDIDDWNGANYCDMFTLIKINNTWQITSKVSHRR